MDYGAPFSADWVSTRMGQISKGILGWGMTASPHRHIIIAFANRKCKGTIDARLEESWMSALHSLQAGHSVLTERRIYGVDKDSLAGVPEDMIISFLDASTEHQKAFHIPPGGQGLPYNRATMASFIHPKAPRTSVAQTSTLEITEALNFLKTAAERSQKIQEALVKEVGLLRAELSSLKGTPMMLCILQLM